MTLFSFAYKISGWNISARKAMRILKNTSIARIESIRTLGAKAEKMALHPYHQMTECTSVACILLSIYPIIFQLLCNSMWTPPYPPTRIGTFPGAYLKRWTLVALDRQAGRWRMRYIIYYLYFPLPSSPLILQSTTSPIWVCEYYANGMWVVIDFGSMWCRDSIGSCFDTASYMLVCSLITMCINVVVDGSSYAVRLDLVWDMFVGARIV